MKLAKNQTNQLNKKTPQKPNQEKKACDNARKEFFALSGVDGVSVFPFQYIMEEHSWEEISKEAYCG